METQEYKPVGMAQVKTTDIRVIAATNQDLKGIVRKSGFREDLFYRLNVFPIYLPPLKERRDDIPRLAYHFLRSFCRQTGKRIEGFSNDALEVLTNHDWPGNVRQLKNVIEHLVIMADGAFLDLCFVSEQLETRRRGPLLTRSSAACGFSRRSRPWATPCRTGRSSAASPGPWAAP
jgi:two-component system NtrC family response regulator